MEQQTQQAVVPFVKTKEFFGKDSVKAKFNELLGSKSAGFISSVLQVVSNNKLLAKADTNSIYQAAAIAAALDLPIQQNLGFAWIVPYGSSAQFQMGYKGFIQLALRTGQYTRMNVVEVYESQFESFNTLTEDLKADLDIMPAGPVVGYAAYFRLLNGFEKTSFWYKSKVEAHGKKYSKSYSSGPWKDNFDGMAKKTVLKDTLSKWGILSIEMQKAYIADQAVIRDADTDTVDYEDATEDAPPNKEFERVMFLLEDCATAEELTAFDSKVDNSTWSTVESNKYAEAYNRLLAKFNLK